MKRPNLFKWKKKIGAVHIGDKNSTLCGKPMLGNNYASQNDEIDCEECILGQIEKEAHANKKTS